MFLGKLLSKWWNIKEAIQSSSRRMLYFSQGLFTVRSRNMCFCSPLPLLDAVRNNGWLSEVWVTCSISQGWTRWPCAGKRQAFEQEAHTGNDRCIVARRLKPCLQSLGRFTVKFHRSIRVSACEVTFYCFSSSTQGVLWLFADFCMFSPQPHVLIKVNRVKE